MAYTGKGRKKLASYISLQSTGKKKLKMQHSKDSLAPHICFLKRGVTSYEVGNENHLLGSKKAHGGASL